MKIIIQNINVIDPFSQRDEILNLLIENGKIISMDSEPIKTAGVDKIIDGKEKVLFPGLMDMHTHLREPGFEYKEDIESGSRAALHGGFTKITAFPNTNPVLDDVESFKRVQQIIQEKAWVEVLPIPAMSKGLAGKELVDFKALASLGAVAFTDDGKGVQNQAFFHQVLDEVKELDLPILIHAEDEELVEGGVIHRGETSGKTRIAGIPAEAEEMMTARDIVLAKKTGVHVHFCHVSTAFAARLIGLAKEEGVSVTAEVAPHHLCLDDSLIQSDKDSNHKMNPPLRSENDKEVLVEALNKGAIDAIATDHAPHSAEEKAKPIQEAPFGITGLETCLPLLYDNLIKADRVSFYRVIEALTLKPAEILKQDFWPICEGADANFVIFNSNKNSELNREFFQSKSENFPLLGGSLSGKVESVFYKNKWNHFENNSFKTINLETGENR